MLFVCRPEKSVPVVFFAQEAGEQIHQAFAYAFATVFRQQDEIPKLKAIAAANTRKKTYDPSTVFAYPDMILLGIILLTQLSQAFQDIAFETDAIAGFLIVDPAVEEGDVAEVAGF